MKKSIFLVFYYFIVQYLPSSFFPFGRVFNQFRIFCLRQIFPIGRNTKIQPLVYVGSGNNIRIGDNCQINEKVKLDNVTISDYVMIAPGVTVLGKMHEFNNIEIPMVSQGEKEINKTEIDEDVWIGTNAIIMPGLKIAKGSIIGAGSVLTKNTVPYGIYGGVPASLIKSRK